MLIEKKILIVDNDVGLSTTLAEQIGIHEPIAVDLSQSSDHALKVATTKNYDAIFIDIELSDLNGQNLCALLRQNNVFCPIILLTANTAHEFRSCEAKPPPSVTSSLSAGANDHMFKPVRLPVLLAKLNSHIRNFEKKSRADFAIGHYIFHFGNKTLIHKKTKNTILLTDKETAIIRLLSRAAPEYVEKSALLEEIWGYNSHVNTHTLETHIYRLRRKIEEDNTPRIITTKASGYRLVCTSIQEF